MRYTPLCVALSVFFFGFVLTGFAQDTDPDLIQGDTLANVTIESVRIEAINVDNAPYSISTLVFSPEIRNGEAALSLEETLSRLLGVTVNDRGNGSIGERISIRGMGARSQFGVRGVQVILDGIPLTMPDGQAFADIVSPAMIQRAEVIRGPSSLFWGNGSGGVVFLSTDAPNDSTRIRIRALGGGFSSVESPSTLHQISAEAKTQLGRSTINAFVSNDQRGGYREYSDSRFTRAAVHATVPLEGTSILKLTGALADQDSENPGQRNAADFDEDPRGAFARNRDNGAGKQSFQAQLSGTLLTETSLGQLSTSVYGIVRDLDNPLGVPYSFAVPPEERVYRYIDLNRLAGGFRIDLQDATPRVQWGIGFDAAVQDDDRRNIDHVLGDPGDDVRLDQQETVRNISTFGFVNINVAGPLSANAGLRGDFIRFSMSDRLLSLADPTNPANGDQSGDRNFNALSPALGISIDLGPSIIYTNYRHAFETPTTTELVNRADTDGVFNPDVDPQTVDGFELGARGTIASLNTSYDLALYTMRVQDRLSSAETPEGRAYFFNAGETTHTGLELSISTAFTSWLTAQLLHHSNQFEYTKGEFDGNQLPGIPDSRTQLFAKADIDPIWLQIAFRSVSSYYVNDVNTEKNQAYSVFDINVGTQGFTMGSSTLYPFFRVANLFDEQYSGSVVINAAGGRFYEPAPGRNFQFGFNLHL